MKNKRGLTQAQVYEKVKRYGYNEIPEKKITLLSRLLKKLWSPIPWMIEAASLVSAILGRWEDFAIIITLLFVNIIVDFKQEAKALNALEVLKNKLAKKALVLRSGKWLELEARLLVPGDIIKLRLGDIIPADARLIEGKYLQIDQSALTGESLPVDKKNGDEVYANAIVKRGEMLAEVTNTGINTFFGKSASLVSKAQGEKQSHFQKAIIKVGNFLIILTLILAVIIFIVSVLRGDDIFESLQFILVLIVASIPVALPAVLSVTMAVGAINIAKRKSIVTNLPVLEELAGIDVLCSDKTGTLTENQMSVHKPIVYDGFSEQDLFTFATLASKRENHDPIEKPIFEYLAKHFPKINLDEYQINKFTPFDPISKYTQATVKFDKQTLVLTKGAPQVIAKLCSDKKIAKQLFIDVNRLADKGFRTLAVAMQSGNTKPKCIGLIPLFDPPRVDSIKVIREVKGLGIDIKMLTGDNTAIAKQISEMLSIGDNISDISELNDIDTSNEYTQLSSIIAKAIYKKINPNVSDNEVKEFTKQVVSEVGKKLKYKKLSPSLISKHESDIITLIENASGFSQVLPEDKYFIIDKLQKNNHIVAMTGDGVNDAPALQKADVGIAVSRATDAARAASDLVLMSPGLSVIYHAIHIARRTFERMKNYAIFRIAETMRVILFMALSIIVFNFYPITAIMIVVLALLNDIPVMMIAYDNVKANSKPVKWNMKEILSVATVLGIVGVASSFLLFYWLYVNGYPLALIQSLLFIKLDVAGHSTLYLTRAGKHHFWHKPWPSMKFFLPAFSSRIIGTLVAVYGIFMQPIGWKYAGYIWIYATIWWIFNDFVKVWTYRIMDRRRI